MKAKIITLILGAALLIASLAAWLKPANDFSESERRVLTALPEFNTQTLTSGEFMTSFEGYALDQFPMRDFFRGVKSVTALGFFRNMDNNGIYFKSGHISKLEYPLNIQMLDHAAERFEYIKNTYLSEENNIYFSIIPDKGYFLSGGRLSLDYDALVEHMRQRTQYMTYIDVFDLLSIEDYYRTDSHWRQDRILKVAERFGDVMGFELKGSFEESTVTTPFYGVYSGQAALPVEPDTIVYLRSPGLDACTLTSFDTGAPQEVPIYDEAATLGRDPYEMFMSGADALLVLENPNARVKRELVIFRDSFASSLVPLMHEGYSKITLVDIRYIQSQMLGNFIDFSDADVLFMYSTTLLNNSLAFK